MKRKRRILLHSMILTFLLTLLVGSMVVHAEGEVTINYKTSTVNLGDDTKLKLAIRNLDEDKKPRWVSYNANVASVDQDGVVTPIRKGKAIISSGIGFPRKICTVTVVDPSVKLNKTAVTLYRPGDVGSVSDNTTTATPAPGSTITLTAKVNGATKKATDVVWSSSDKEVATVAQDTKGRGVVTSVKAGEAVITAKVNGRTASCKVTVQESTISLNVAEMTLSNKGAGSSFKLIPTIVGANKKVTWTSSAPTIARVSGGKVTGKATGEAVITAKANGAETTCTVTVQAGKISINEEKVQLYVTETKNAEGESTIAGEQKDLKTNAANSDTVKWTSSDPDIATVENIKANGSTARVKALKAGKVTITATCNEGTENESTDSCVIDVTGTATSITDRIVYLRTKGAAKTYKLGYKVTGRKNAVAWSSSDKSVVSVSKGKLTGKKAGKATITMTANGVTDTVQVTVQDYTPTIALNQNEYILYNTGKGNTVSLKATVSGASRVVEWKSDNTEIATVNKGKVTANTKGKEGRTLITATANGVTAKCWITVKTPQIIIEKNALVIKPNQKVNLREEASIEVTGASQSVTYQSSDVKIATVNGKGLVTAKKAGQVTIKVKANGVEDKCSVTVSACEEHKWEELSTTLSLEDSDGLNQPATCDKSGRETRECSVCHGLEQKVTPPTGHSFGTWTAVVWSTENGAGLEKQVCTKCKAQNTRSIPAKNKGEMAYGYKLVWEDEFNGSALNRDDWNVELHDPGWVNAEWQAYVDKPENIYVKDGNLVIQAIKTGEGEDATYTSGRVNTQNRHDYQYGRFEARAKVPSGKGFLPAFWMMPTDENYYGQWPKCGEIDVMEVMGRETNKAYGTLHFGEPHTQSQGTYTLSEDEADFAADFHVYACEWDPDEFRFYVDGNLFYTVNDWFSKTPGTSEPAYPAPYDQPFYMILNLAVGGSWVGNPDATTQFGDNAQLVVDYVRVYQKDEYDTNVSKPGKDVQLREPDEDGNYIVNGDFSEVEDLSKTEAEQVNWKLHLEQGGEAVADNADGVLNVATTKEGSLSYSVQIVQANLPLEKGSSYKLTFDAWADAARTITTAVKAPDRGYYSYMAETTVNLTTTRPAEPFEYTFNMTSDSDPNGRLEFNLGNQGSTAAVHIDDVKLVKMGEAEEEEEVKGALADGNYVYNGSFNEGNLPGRFRLAYWDWDIDRCKGASVSVTDDAARELKVVVPESVEALEDVVVSQKPIAIIGGKDYVLSFDAHADSDKTITTTIAGKTFDSLLGKAKKTYQYEFTTADSLNGSELRFLLGAAGATYIDNISIRENGLIINGDFSSGMVGYEVFCDASAKAPAYTVDSLNEDNAFSIDIEDTGDADWKIQLKQNKIKLEKGQWYKLTLDAKSTINRKLMYALQKDGSSDDVWTPYSGQPVVELSPEWQTFSKSFEMTSETDPRTILSISMGAVGGTRITDKHTVRIDNIRLEEIEAQEEPPAPPIAEGTELITNGDFSDGSNGWSYAPAETGKADVSFTGEKATYEIASVGTEDWHVQLKQGDLRLEKDASYDVSFKIKSTVARTVKSGFITKYPDSDWYAGHDLELTANVETEEKYSFTAKGTSDIIEFYISMGQIKDENGNDVETPLSTIVIDDISVKKTSGGTGEEPEVPDDPIAYGTDLIKNGDFSDGNKGWESGWISDDADVTSTFENKKARFEIRNAGKADYEVQLKQDGLAMEKDEKYKVNFKIGSSMDRKVRLAIMGAKDVWCDGADIDLTANKLISYSQIVTLGSDYESGTVAFQISMGQLGNETLAAHAIEISDVSVTKVEAGTEADEVTTQDVTIEPPAGSGDDPIEEGENLIKNGDFKSGKTNWNELFFAGSDGTGAEGNATFTDGKARYEITKVGTDDWHVQLKQTGLAMKKDASYKVNFKIASSIGRTVKVAFMNDSNEWYSGEEIQLNANKLKSFSQVFKMENDIEDTDVTLNFQISMGKLGTDELEAHAIEISDISVIEVAEGTQVDTVPDTDYQVKAPGTGEEDPDPTDDENLIKNGDFSKGEENWEGSQIYTDDGAAGTKTFTDGKATFDLTNVGTANWHVQLKQSGLTLEKDAKYALSFKIKSTVARTVEYTLMNDSGDTSYSGYRSVVLNDTSEQSVEHEFTMNEETKTDVNFVISMGKITGVDTPASTIEISDIKLVKVEDGTTTAPETPEEGGDTPDTPPTGDNNGSGSAVEARSDRTGGNSEDASDDTEDMEETDPAQQETPETQNDSAGGEESVDPSGIDQEEISEE